MSGVSKSRVVWVWGREGLGGYQPGVYVPLKALFLVLACFYLFTHFQERKNTRKIQRFSDLPTLPCLRHVRGNKAIFILRLN